MANCGDCLVLLFCLKSLNSALRLIFNYFYSIFINFNSILHKKRFTDKDLFGNCSTMFLKTGSKTCFGTSEARNCLVSDCWATSSSSSFSLFRDKIRDKRSFSFAFSSSLWNLKNNLKTKTDAYLLFECILSMLSFLSI